MKPPVDAPASRQRRPATTKPVRLERRQRAGQLVPAARDVVGAVRVVGDHDRDVGGDAGRRLGGDRAGHLDPALGDQLAGVLARAGQAAADQLGVQAESSRGTVRRVRSACVGVVEGAAQLGVRGLEDPDVLLERALLELLDGRDHVVDVRRPRCAPARARAASPRARRGRAGRCSVMRPRLPRSGRGDGAQVHRLAGVVQVPPGRRRGDPPPVLGIARRRRRTSRPSVDRRRASRRAPCPAVATSGAGCGSQQRREVGRDVRRPHVLAAPPPARRARSRRSAPAASRGRRVARPRCRCRAGRRPSAGARRRPGARSRRAAAAPACPATTGLDPVKSRSIATWTPCPGATPNAVGIGEVGVAGHPRQPVADPDRARMIALHRTSGPYPVTTATGSSSADADRLQAGRPQRLLAGPPPPRQHHPGAGAVAGRPAPAPPPGRR